MENQTRPRTARRRAPRPHTAPIAVVGDLIIDEFADVDVEPSIEATVDVTYRTRSRSYSFGGAGLVARVAAAYTSSRIHLLHPAPGVEFSDSKRRLACHLRGAVVGGVHQRKLRVRTDTSRFRLDFGNGTLQSSHRSTGPALVDLTLPPERWDTGCVVLADYRGMLHDHFRTERGPYWSDVLGATPKYLVIDPHRTRALSQVVSVLRRVDVDTVPILKLNTDLMQRWTLAGSEESSDAKQLVLRELASAPPGKRLHVWETCGGEPGWYFLADEGGIQEFQLPLPEVSGRVVSAVGAGDVATASLAIGLASGLELQEALAFGHAAATLKTQLWRTDFPEWREVARHFPVAAWGRTTAPAAGAASGRVLRYNSLPAMGTLKPLHLTQDRELLEKCLRSALKTDSPPWARPGGPLVANGVFDGLHAGHQRVLTHCKQGREALIVGLNSDESLRKLGRTAHASCEDRARAIAQLRGVDLIVVYDDETPDALYDLVRQVSGGPVTIVKGDEYAEQARAGTLPGVKPGDDVRLIPQIPGLSSTGIRKLIESAPENGASAGEDTACDRVRGCACC